MMLVAGECVGITTRSAGSPGQEFVETKIHVLDQTGEVPRTVEATTAREFRGSLPGRGEVVVLDVVSRVFKTRDGVGQALTAFGRNSDLEAVFADALVRA